MILQFEGDEDLAIRAYNAGPTHVKKAEAGVLDDQICNIDGMKVVTKYHCQTEHYSVKVWEFKKVYQQLGLH